jgi:hypothetical protein
MKGRNSDSGESRHWQPLRAVLPSLYLDISGHVGAYDYEPAFVRLQVCSKPRSFRFLLWCTVITSMYITVEITHHLKSIIDMPWEPTIVEQFQFDHNVADESRFYGPYITLLTNLFPPTDHYQVAPRCNSSPGSSNSIDFTIMYGLPGTHQFPILFLQIKPFIHLEDPAKRERADHWMRDRFRELCGPDLTVPKLYGICAMGTLLCGLRYAIRRRTASHHLRSRVIQTSSTTLRPERAGIMTYSDLMERQCLDQ